jgi:hypothetical protein
MFWTGARNPWRQRGGMGPWGELAMATVPSCTAPLAPAPKLHTDHTQNLSWWPCGCGGKICSVLLMLQDPSNMSIRCLGVEI